MNNEDLKREIKPFVDTYNATLTDDAPLQQTASAGLTLIEETARRIKTAGAESDFNAYQLRIADEILAALSDRNEGDQ